jgi:hypothetical protein
MIQAFHLPALSHLTSNTWSYGSGEAEVRLRIPQVTAELLRTQIRALLEARARHLEARPVRQIVEAIDQVAGRLANPRDALRQIAEQALPAVTSYSLPMVRCVLDRMAADWRAPRLHELLREEFGGPEVLDGFCARPQVPGRTRAFGPRLTVHVFSGNVPGVAVTSLIRALLVKSASVGKTAAGEPLLPALFAQGLAEADPELGACLAVTYWPGGNADLERVALAAAEAVIVYGSDEVVAGVRARSPAHARFLGYGHKLSFGLVGREALGAGRAAEVAEQAAGDVAMFDQQGCVSPHVFYVETGGETEPRQWAARLAAAMAALDRTLPRGVLSPSEAAAIRQTRGEAEFSQLAGTGVQLHASPDSTAWTVIYDPDSAFAASCLNRVVWVRPIDDLAAVAGRVEAIDGFLQSAGAAVDPARLPDLAATLGRLGVSRVVPLGQMAWPPPAWHHDGRPPLRDLVRWCDIEA